MNSLLSVADLGVERGGRLVLSNLSFTLDAGEAILVAGRNGAGKSTLLRTLAGLLPAHVGRIAYGLASDEVRGVETTHYLGYEDALKPSLSVGENLEFWAAMLGDNVSLPLVGRGQGWGLSGQGKSLAEKRGTDPHPCPSPQGGGELTSSASARSPEHALAAFGIARLIDLPAGYLSAGQKRRVALARLLLASRPIWLLDEPLIALDTVAQATLTTIMAGHVAAGGAILVASHQTLDLPHRRIDLDA